jgi:hypothetical protein
MRGEKFGATLRVFLAVAAPVESVGERERISEGGWKEPRTK